MTQAFEELFGVADGFAHVEFSGMTDRFILQGGLDAHCIQGGCETHLERFTQRYYELLPDSLRERKGHLMPGFPQLLQALSNNDRARLGLATGNFKRAAMIKLDYYGLSKYFSGGGFGEESLHRGDLVRAAIERVANGAEPQDVFVIGDTPHDVASALDNGVMAVGVATGNYSVEQLQASGAQVVFSDFADWRSAAAALLAEPLGNATHQVPADEAWEPGARRS